MVHFTLPNVPNSRLSTAAVIVDLPSDRPTDCGMSAAVRPKSTLDIFPRFRQNGMDGRMDAEPTTCFPSPLPQSCWSWSHNYGEAAYASFYLRLLLPLP